MAERSVGAAIWNTAPTLSTPPGLALSPAPAAMSDDDLAALEAEIDAEEAKQSAQRSGSKRPQRSAAAPAPPVARGGSRSAAPMKRPPPPVSHSDDAMDDDGLDDDPYDKIDFKKIAAMTAAAHGEGEDGGEADGTGAAGLSDEAVDADMRALMREIHEEGGDVHGLHSEGEADSEDEELSRLEREGEATSPAEAARQAAERAQVEKETQRRLQAETTSAAPFAAPPAPETVEQVLASLQRQLEGSKKKALEYHRAGKKEEALEVMKNVKTLQARIQQMESGRQQPPAPPAAPLSSPPSPSSTSSTSSSASSTADSVDVLSALRIRVVEYQRAAVAHKQANRLDRAKALMVDIIRMKTAIEEAQAGQGRVLTSADLPPPLDSVTQTPKLSRQSSGSGLGKPPSASTAPPPLPMPPPRPVSRPPSASPPPIPPRSPARQGRGGALTTKQSLQYATLINSLNTQADELQHQMTQLLAAAASAAAPSSSSTPQSSSSTTERTYKLLALQFHRLLKRTKGDIDLLQTAMARSIPPPSYHTTQEKLAMVHEHAELTDEQLLLLLHSSRDLTDAVYSVTVQWEGGGQVSTYNSGTARGPDVEWKGKWTLQLGKRSKSMVKAVSRSRVLLVLYRQRMILGSVEVGRGEMRLKELSAKCDKREAIKVKDAEGKRVGEVTVEVRLRRPLEKMEIREAIRNIVTIDEFEPSATTPTSSSPSSASSPSAVPCSGTQHSVGATSTAYASHGSAASAHPRTPSPSPASTGGAASTAPPLPAATLPLPPGLTEDDVSDPHSVLSMFSNDVLEWEIQQHVPLLLQLARQRGDQAAVEDLTDRLTSLQTQLQILVTAVQAGKLQLDEYLARLREAIDRGQMVAKELMRRGRKEDAKVVIQRVQLMRTELKTAEDNADELA